MIDDLVARVRPSGQGRMLDLACGTGQITFAVSGLFAEVRAIDQEADMIDLVRKKAAAAGAGNVHAVVSSAQDVVVRAGSLELVAIGNAFHRLHRDRVARDAFGWLQPGRCLALLWGTSPWAGDQGWQHALSAVMESWKSRLGAQPRVPDGWDRARREHPDTTVLTEAGFQPAGSYRFLTDHTWTADALIGFVYSTSVLPRRLLADRAGAFETELRFELDGHAIGGEFHETIDFAYELARKPD